MKYVYHCSACKACESNKIAAARQVRLHQVIRLACWNGFVRFRLALRARAANAGHGRAQMSDSNMTRRSVGFVSEALSLAGVSRNWLRGANQFNLLHH
jgi:hypothetical protein